MQKDPNAAEKARRAERKADEKSGLITIKPMKIESTAGRGGFKKGGFKSAFGPAADAAVMNSESTEKPGFKEITSNLTTDTVTVPGYPTDAGDDSEDEAVGYTLYDPRKPTGCDGTCSMSKS